jgi:hypothetical protein
VSFGADGSADLTAGFPAELFTVAGEPGAIRDSATGWLEFGIQAVESADQIRSLDTSLFDQARDEEIELYLYELLGFRTLPSEQ